ncbi:MAG: hypothetical protein ACERJ2_09855 [Filomicrobium sp.]
MHKQVAWELAALYDVSFGGKQLGRFRISLKLMRELSGRRRLYEDDVDQIRRELFELGYVLIDMQNYFAVLSQRTLSSYRRVNEDQITPRSAPMPESRDTEDDGAYEE